MRSHVCVHDLVMLKMLLGLILESKGALLRGSDENLTHQLLLTSDCHALLPMHIHHEVQPFKVFMQCYL